MKTALPMIGPLFFILCCSTAYGQQGAPHNQIELQANLKASSHKLRVNTADKGFDYYKNYLVYKEPLENGVYIVNGDTPIPTDEMLYDFYLKEIVSHSQEAEYGVKLVVDAPGGNIAAWDENEKINLNYCISKDFGPHYNKVVTDLKAATDTWTKAANVRFYHEESLDTQCDEYTTGVTFDVRPVDVNGKYLARAFFPRYERVFRNILIDKSSLNLNQANNLQLVGILRHELGHVLGFRHEHTRPEAGKCYEDPSWVPLTSYDAFSVMHYPQCNGLGDWSLNLTARDRAGAASLYGGPVEQMPTPVINRVIVNQ